MIPAVTYITSARRPSAPLRTRYVNRLNPENSGAVRNVPQPSVSARVCHGSARGRGGRPSLTVVVVVVAGCDSRPPARPPGRVLFGVRQARAPRRATFRSALSTQLFDCCVPAGRRSSPMIVITTRPPRVPGRHYRLLPVTSG